MSYILPPGHWYQRTTSYRGSGGAFFLPGSFGMGFGVRLASITDGTSNTMLFSETTSSWCHPIAFSLWTLISNRPGWNSEGQRLFFDAQYPPNPKRLIDATSFFAAWANYSMASSMHPGGVNVAFADGSVHFIKDSISSWPLINFGFSYGPPSSYYTFGATGGALTPAARLGAWQRLATINGGELVSSDQY
jgi:prepilin-type processing-associated H-X9-DG protein